MRFRRRNPAAFYDVVALDADTKAELVSIGFAADSPREAEEKMIAYIGQMGLMYAGPGRFEPRRGGGGKIYSYFRQWRAPVAAPVVAAPVAAPVEMPPVVAAPVAAPVKRGPGRPRKMPVTPPVVAAPVAPPAVPAAPTPKAAVESPVAYIASKADAFIQSVIGGTVTVLKAAKTPRVTASVADKVKEFERIAKLAAGDAEAATNTYVADYLVLNRDVLEHVAATLSKKVTEAYFSSLMNRPDSELAPQALATLKDYKVAIKGGKQDVGFSVAQQAADVIRSQSKANFEAVSDKIVRWKMDEELLFGSLLSSNAPIAFFNELDEFPFAVFSKRTLQRANAVTKVFPDREVFIYLDLDTPYRGAIVLTWRGGKGRLRLFADVLVLNDEQLASAVRVLLKTPYGSNPARRRRRY